VSPLPNLAPSLNVAPTQGAAVVRRHPDTGARHLDLLKWGLLPYWTKEPTRAQRPINARSETVPGHPPLLRSGDVARLVARGAEAPHMSRVPYHRFKVGQTVVAPSGGTGAYIPRGQHVIVRLLPILGRQPQYRVRSTADGLERVVAEDQITLAAEPWTPAEPPPSKTPVRRR
jgi:hypothetical protein